MTIQYLNCDECKEEVLKGASHRGATLCSKCKSKHAVGDSCNGKDTNDVTYCENKGCGFNEYGICGATNTECFGYIECTELIASQKFNENQEDHVITVPECVDCGTFLVSNAMRINFCPNCELKT